MPNLGDVITDPSLLQQLDQPQAAASAKLGAPVDPTTAKLLDQLPGDSNQAPKSYTFNYLPFSENAQGQVSFDSNAGVLGGIKRLLQAAAAPGDVYTGKLPTPYSGSGSTEPSPELTNRALDFAMAFSPTSAALRAGSAIPGVATKTVVPSAQELKDAAARGYDAARASDVSVPGSDVTDMARQAMQTLQGKHGIIEKTAPKTYGILNELATSPAVGAGDSVLGTYPGLAAVREGLSAINLEGKTEGFAAGKVIPELDKLIERISPEAAVARANLAAAKRANALTGDLTKANTGILEQAEARAEASHSGTNIDNSIRQRVASFLQNPQNLYGYSQPEIDALNNLVKGGAVQNASRRIGNYFGGGGGLGSLAATAAGAALGGHMMPGIEGTALGAAIPTALGISAKGLENTIARSRLNSVDELIRSRAPLAQSYLSAPSLGISNSYFRPLGFAPAPQEMPPSLADIMARRLYY